VAPTCGEKSEAPKFFGSSRDNTDMVAKQTFEVGVQVALFIVVLW